MKRWIGGVTLLMVCMFFLFQPLSGKAQASDMGGLTSQELYDWAGRMLNHAKMYKPVSENKQPVQTEDGYAVQYDFATLYLSTPVLRADSVLNAILITQFDVECPRNIEVTDTQEMLLSAFANENPSLTGNRDFAVLYLSDSRPEEVLWGRVQREGQQVDTVQYAVHEKRGGDQYSDCGLVYTIENGYVTAVRAYGLSSVVSGEQVEEVFSEVAAVQLEDSYFAYQRSSIGTDLDPFGREDLSFSGLDYLGLSPEEAIHTLGAFETETWLLDDNGEWMRIIQWPEVEITFIYNGEKIFERIDTLSFLKRGIEGPRGVMIGDSLSGVMMRFRHSDGEYDIQGREVLYGDGQTAPYGLANYDNAMATLHYVFEINEGGGKTTYMLQMIFVDTTLSELFLNSW